MALQIPVRCDESPHPVKARLPARARYAILEYFPAIDSYQAPRGHTLGNLNRTALHVMGQLLNQLISDDLDIFPPLPHGWDAQMQHVNPELKGRCESFPPRLVLSNRDASPQ